MTFTPELNTRQLLALAKEITQEEFGGFDAPLVAVVFQRLCYEVDMSRGLESDEQPMHTH